MVVTRVGNDNVDYGIVKHLGIALRGKDCSFVACTKAERDLVRDHFLKKILKKNARICAGQSELDRSFADVCQMHGDRDKPRVTFYYLLAERFGKLSIFH
jgi:hypothetical protein